MKNLTIVCAILLAAGLIAMAAVVTLDFEDLPMGSSYNVGDVFFSAGTRLEIDDFQWDNGIWTSAGYARIDNLGTAGGMGQDMILNNVNLVLDPSGWGVTTRIDLLYGEYGGNLNIEINSDFRNFQDFADIDGLTIGGVLVTANDFGPAGNSTGELLLEGVVQTFSIGGQELWIDDVNAEIQGCFISSVM